MIEMIVYILIGLVIYLFIKLVIKWIRKDKEAGPSEILPYSIISKMKSDVTVVVPPEKLMQSTLLESDKYFVPEMEMEPPKHHSHGDCPTRHDHGDITPSHHTHDTDTSSSHHSSHDSSFHGHDYTPSHDSYSGHDSSVSFDHHSW